MAEEVATTVNDSAVQDTATTDSSTVETPSLEMVTDGKELNPNDFREAEPETEEVEAEAETVEETKEEAPTESDKPLSPKAENRFQQLANENRQMREQLEALKLREAQVATEQDLVNEVNPETGEYYTPQEIERIAFLQAKESQAKTLAEQRSELELQNTQQLLGTEALQVTSEIPIFREVNADGSKNPEYVPEIAAEYNNLLGDNLLYRYADGNVYTANVLTANGIDLQQATLVGSNISPYKLAKTIATAYKASAVPNQIKGQKATEKMLSEADNVSSAKPSKASAADVSKMSADEYAKASGMKPVW